MNKLTIGMEILLLVSVIANCFLYIKLNEANSEIVKINLKYKELEEQYNNLLNSYNVLLNNYNVLVGTYDILTSNYSLCEQQYSELLIKYNNLLYNYNVLLNNYNVLNEPLRYEVKPRTFEVVFWLKEDNTNELEYPKLSSNNGEIAIILAQRAKLKNWKFGIECIIGYADGIPYQKTLNTVVCVSGLIYINPQSDYSWWYENREHIYPGDRWEIDGTWVNVTNVIIISCL